MALVVGVGAGCGSSAPATQLDPTVVVDAALGLTSVQVTVTAPGRPNLSKTFVVAKATGTPPVVPPILWQIEITTAPRPFTATVEARGTANGLDVVDDVQVVVTPGAHVAVRLSLTADCLGVSCPIGKTCISGACAGVPIVGPPPTDAGARDANGDANGDASADINGETNGSDVGAGAAGGGGSDAAPGADAPGSSDVPIEAPNNQPCGVDTDCPQDFHCNAAHACIPKVANGVTCAVGGECHTGFCVAGVCCNEACGDVCKACTAKLTAGVDGTCGVILSGTADARCTNASGAPCGDTGNCDGKGACELPGSSKICAPAACNAGSFTASGTCSNGTCGVGAVTICGSYACVVATGCATKCTLDTDCPGGYCAAGGTCAVKKTDGTACGGTNECLASHFCVGNAAGTAKVCCNAACTGTCTSCFAKDTGGADGTCQSISLGGSSNGQCPNDNAPPCGHPGTCDGKGGCYTPPSGTSCGGTMCSGSTLTAARTCNGSGMCQAAAAGACPGSLVCASTSACKTSCAADGDCTTGYCGANGACTAKQGDGTGCTASDMCTNANCASGLCCPAGDKRCGNACIPSAGCCAASDCAGVCQTCTNNVCGPVKNAADPDSCAGTCDANGACKGTQGQTCPANGCLAGLTCAEGVCCNSACNTTCTSCLSANTSLATGTCGPVTNGHSHGSDCSVMNSQTCGTTGTCNGAGACTRWPAGTMCAPATCSAGNTIATAALTCNGSGSCSSGGASTPCGSYQCNASTALCKSGACVSTAVDCSSTSFCSSSGCIPLRTPGQTCSQNSDCTNTNCGSTQPSGYYCPGGICGQGGRCCPNGVSCYCPQPTTANLFTNPGFDSNLNGWTQTHPGGGSSITIDTTSPATYADADGCPSSFSAEVTTVAGTASPQLSQCAAVSAGSTYLYGASISNGDSPTETLLCNEDYCALTWWTGSGCSGSDIVASDPSPITWEDFQWFNSGGGTSMVAPANAVSAKMTCYTDTPYSGNTCIAHFDKIFLDLSPNVY